MSNLFIKNIRLPNKTEQDMLIQRGIIAALGAPGSLNPPDGVPLLEGEGRLAVPGAVDMHVHFRQPGGEHKETLLSGAAAAVKGGTTTCGDMPNTSPRTTTLAALEEKIELSRGAEANLLFNFGAEADNLEQVRLAAANPAVKALKIYMGPSTGQGGLAPQHVQQHFRQAAELGLPVMVHAEDIELIEASQGAYPHDAQHHDHLRPAEAEARAVRMALDWSREYGAKLYLCHVTSPEVLRLAEESGIRDRVFVEVCPHHLLLSTEQIVPPLENRFKVNPPIRDEEHRVKLFQGLSAKNKMRIDALATDHAPHTLQEKGAPYDDAPSGIPAVEYLLPLALNWWNEGAFDLHRMIDLTSRNVSDFLGLNKGRLEVGRDADLVLVNPESEWVISAGDDRIKSKCGWTIYEGKQIRGKPEITIVGGRIAFQHQSQS